MKKQVLAADLGGTNLRMAVVGEDGEILYRIRGATPPKRTREEVTGLILDLAAQCIKEADNGTAISGFGIAAPAVVDQNKGFIRAAPNLPDLNGYAISDDLAKQLDLPVVLENDATAAGIGENWLGASKGFDNSICLTLGTGVGGGLIVNGQPLRGVDGTAGEVGHVCVEPFGAPCGCGSVGCLEQYSSATAVVKMARLLKAEFPSSILDADGALTSLDVYNAAVDGDDLATEVFRRFGFYLGIAMGGLVNLLNPEVIVIGGGASQAWPLFIDAARDEMIKRAFREPAERVKLVRAGLGDDAGILGVAKLAINS
ncbi:MAG: ROK family protein [Acidobacteria bacterium]|nr:ROK family protein [Acidobacteriota bacterium]